MKARPPDPVLIDAVKLSPAEIQGILDRLDQRDAQDNQQDRREAPRLTYRVRAVIVELKQSGRDVSLLVPTRNISRTGLAFLHRQMMHVDTPCRVKLLLPHDHTITASARVARCEHVGGIVHEIGLQFGEPIELPDASAMADPPA